MLLISLFGVAVLTSLATSDQCDKCHEHAVCDRSSVSGECICKCGYLGDGNDCKESPLVAANDGSIKLPNKCALTKNALLTTIPRLASGYIVKFQVFPTVFQHGWTNVLHFTASGQNIRHYGDRTPGVWFHHASNPQQTKNRFHICSAVNRNRNYCVNTGSTISRGQWTDVEISQVRNVGDIFYKYIVKINGVPLTTTINMAAQGFNDVKVFAGDNFYNVAPGFIRNFTVVPDADKGVNSTAIDISETTAAIAGVWSVAYSNGHQAVFDISPSGKMKITWHNGRQHQETQILPSNDEDDFPHSDGWVMGVSIYRPGTWEYYRLRTLADVSYLQVEHFCIRHCRRRRNNLDKYCCYGAGYKTDIGKEEGNQPSMMALVGSDIGKTSWGTWTKYVQCPSQMKITGFRLQVEGEQNTGDNTALNGIQFSCEGGENSEKIEFKWGTWTAWKTCDSGYVTELDVKAMASVGSAKDDYGATNVRVKCSEDDVKVGDGLNEGDWVGYHGCQANYHMCGARAKIEGSQGNGDDTALNRIQVECCPDFQAMIAGPDVGKTSWGTWGLYAQCPSQTKITGFRLQVEGKLSTGDNTALNGIQFRCEGGKDSEKIEFKWGTWTAWKTCDSGYVTELDVKAMASVGSAKDDYGATNVRVKCSGGDIKVGDGLNEGDWVGYHGCQANHHICGARAKIEGDQGSGDDTALNRIQVGCCPDIQEIAASIPNSVHWHDQGEVCFGAKGDAYGKFTLTRSGKFKGIQLTHISGWVSCAVINPEKNILPTNFGCNHDMRRSLGTVVSTSDNAVIFPHGQYYGMYAIQGFDAFSKNLAFSNWLNPMRAKKGEEFRIWFSEDIVKQHDRDNMGQTCVFVRAFIE